MFVQTFINSSSLWEWSSGNLFRMPSPGSPRSLAPPAIIPGSHILIKMNRIHLMFDFPHVFLGQNYKNWKQQQNSSEPTSSAGCWENFSPRDSMKKWRKTFSYNIPRQQHDQPGPSSDADFIQQSPPPPHPKLILTQSELASKDERTEKLSAKYRHSMIPPI